jgi:predicted dehydrogenase
LEIEGRTALLWPGYDLGLDTLALDMMHADLDLAVGLLGPPGSIHVAATERPAGRGSAAVVLLDYADTVARCTSSSLMPDPYQMRGGYRATFPQAVLEYTMQAGFTGQGPATLTEFTATGAHPVELPQVSPYAEMIDHVLACLTDNTTENQIEPASAMPALELTLQVSQRLCRPA